MNISIFIKIWISVMFMIYDIYDRNSGTTLPRLGGGAW
jgi:hypothetical protein